MCTLNSIETKGSAAIQRYCAKCNITNSFWRHWYPCLLSLAIFFSSGSFYFCISGKCKNYWFEIHWAEENVVTFTSLL